MTQEQANEIVMLIRAAAAHPIDQLTIEYFETRMLALEHEPALTAATLGAGVWNRFPSWAVFMEMYRSQRKQGSGREPVSREAFGARGKIPFWVKRWLAARYLYEHFGRDQDRRPFTEQKTQVDPFDQGEVEWMPETEWIDEGKKVDDRTAWNILTRDDVRT